MAFASAFGFVRASEHYAQAQAQAEAQAAARELGVGGGAESAAACGSGVAGAPRAAASAVSGGTAVVEAGNAARGGSGRRSGAASADTVVVSARQRGNRLLRELRNVTWRFGDTAADFELGEGACALYLSLQFHLRKPSYIVERMKAVGRDYRLRVVLVSVDVEDCVGAIEDLSGLATRSEFTLVLTWSLKEAARYVETFKLYARKTAVAIREKVDDAYEDRLIDVLTTVRSVNKSDAAVLVQAFGSVAGVMRAEPDEIAMCPGFGSVKAQRLYDVLHSSLT